MNSHLFQNVDTEITPLIEYIDTYANNANTNFNLFQLPPIQRNSVWNVVQIEKLWDSLLRGYPIGSFLVAKRDLNKSSRDLLTGTQKESQKEGYFLLDGQQRTRSLLLGFKPNENARLWIDLNPNLSFGNTELNDRKFLFRVITNYQPWGMSDRNPADKLLEHTKYPARDELGIANVHYDYQVPISVGENDFIKGNSWPIKSELPIPFDLLMNLCGGTTGKYIEPTWAEVIKLIPERYHNDGKVPKLPTDHFSEILKALIPLLDFNSKEIRTRNVVLLFQNETENYTDPEIQDDMEVLFRRVNSGGTVLQGDEMAYSLLKSSWDGAYEMVSAITTDEKIGYLLPSTSIVMAASRLARFIQGESDNPNPGIGNFRRWIGEKAEPGEKSFIETMQFLLVKENSKALFHKIIESFCDLIIYRDSKLEDIGLPKKLLLAIKNPIYHPVLIWIYLNNCDKEILEKERKAILRFLIYSFLTIEKTDKASKVAIEVIKEQKNNTFPESQIYQALLDEELSVIMPTPQELSLPFNLSADGFLRGRNEIFNIEEDRFNQFRQLFWNKKEILLWSQRKYLPQWFPGYDPTSNDAYDTPYDWDHIVPKSHLIISGASPNIYSTDQELNKKIDYSRGLYINSIGNYRIWPGWCNRSDGNQCHTIKLRMLNTDWENDEIAKGLGLADMNNFLEASAINIEDYEYWLNARGDVRDWPEERRIAWQTAVEKRICYLYEEIYLALEYNIWTASIKI